VDNDETCSDVKVPPTLKWKLVATDRHSVTIVCGSDPIRTYRVNVAIVTAGDEVRWRYQMSGSVSMIRNVCQVTTDI